MFVEDKFGFAIIGYFVDNYRGRHRRVAA